MREKTLSTLHRPPSSSFHGRRLHHGRHLSNQNSTSIMHWNLIYFSSCFQIQPLSLLNLISNLLQLLINITPSLSIFRYHKKSQLFAYPTPICPLQWSSCATIKLKRKKKKKREYTLTLDKRSRYNTYLITKYCPYKSFSIMTNVEDLD